MSFSLKDKHIIVNYHYVQDPSNGWLGIHPCSVKEFEKQIKFLSENYLIVSVDQVFNTASKKSSERLCAITFDDGLKDQYKNAVPVLEKYNATAIFFPITKTLDGFLPTTHKIHVLLSKYSSEELVDRCNHFLKNNHFDEFLVSKDKRITLKRKLLDDIITANFKETFIRLPKEAGEKCLNQLFKDLFLDEKKISKLFFLDKSEIRNLIKKRFSIGGHGESHQALDFQTDGLVSSEISNSKKHLEDIIEKSLTVFSYPQNGFNKKIIDVLRKNGFNYGLTIEKRAVSLGDDSLMMPRYDTGDIKYFLNKI